MSNSSTAHRLTVAALGARLHLVPLHGGDAPAVADELARQLRAEVGREELRGLDLLHEHERLRLGARARLVVAREGEEDDEAEQDGEARREDAEHAGRAVAVREVAALGRAAADEQHRGDRDARHGRDDEEPEEEVHDARA